MNVWVQCEGRVINGRCAVCGVDPGTGVSHSREMVVTTSVPRIVTTGVGGGPFGGHVGLRSFAPTADELMSACAFLDATEHCVMIDNAGPWREWGATVGDGDDIAGQTLALAIVFAAERLGWKR